MQPGELLPGQPTSGRGRGRAGQLLLQLLQRDRIELAAANAGERGVETGLDVAGGRTLRRVLREVRHHLRPELVHGVGEDVLRLDDEDDRGDAEQQREHTATDQQRLLATAAAGDLLGSERLRGGGGGGGRDIVHRSVLHRSARL